MDDPIPQPWQAARNVYARRCRDGQLTLLSACLRQVAALYAFGRLEMKGSIGLLLVLSTVVLSAADAAAADAAAGEKLFRSRCMVCHSIESGAKHKVGPNLFGVVGAKIGTRDGYKYSPSYVAAGNKGVVWSDENLAEYLADPKPYIVKVSADPKAATKMTFKLAKKDEQQDVIAYLKTLK